RKGNSQEAVAQLRALDGAPDENKSDIVKQLIPRKAFKEAYEVWRTDKLSPSERTPPSLYDGGFEGSLSHEDTGFGWRVSRSSPGVRLSVDSTQPHTGSRALLIEFLGESNPSAPIISQLDIVEPSRHYRLSFAARTKDIVTGGLPMVVVNDVTTG